MWKLLALNLWADLQSGSTGGSEASHTSLVWGSGCTYSVRAAFELQLIDASNRWIYCRSVYGGGGTVRLLPNAIRNLLSGMSTLDISNLVFRVLMIEFSSSSPRPVGVLSLIRTKSFFYLLDLYNVRLHHAWFPSEIAWPGLDF